MPEPIMLQFVLRIDDPGAFKLHLASWNGKDEPLDVFVRSRAEWDVWSAWRLKRDDFNRERIFALIRYYHQADTWLFGNAYRVQDRQPIADTNSYTIEALPEHEAYVGRLMVRFVRPGRARVVNFENHYADIEVAEILPEPYSGEAFPGYDWLDVGFAELEAVVERQRPDWKAALEHQGRLSGDGHELRQVLRGLGRRPHRCSATQRPLSTVLHALYARSRVLERSASGLGSHAPTMRPTPTPSALSEPGLRLTLHAASGAARRGFETRPDRTPLGREARPKCSTGTWLPEQDSNLRLGD